MNLISKILYLMYLKMDLKKSNYFVYYYLMNLMMRHYFFLKGKRRDKSILILFEISFFINGVIHVSIFCMTR